MEIIESPNVTLVDERPVALERALTRRAARQVHVTLLVLAAGVLLAAALLHSEGEARVVLPWVGTPLPELCSWRRALGINCPGCGLTRSFIALAEGDVRRAWHYNPAGLAVFAVVAFQLPYRSLQLWRLARGRPEFRLPFPTATLLVVLVLLVAQWLWRLAF